MGNLPDRYIYPGVFRTDEDGISVYFPDLPGCLTCGDTMEEAFRMARDALSGYLATSEEEGDLIPTPSLDAKFPLEDNERVVFVEAWMPPYRENSLERSVKKTVTLPRWLEEAAAEQKVNFSRVLQEGLLKQLGLDAARVHSVDTDVVIVRGESEEAVSETDKATTKG